MNFRKLLLTRCEKQFNKMLQQEQADRKERRLSMEAIQKEDLNSLKDDFSSLTMQLYDESELRQRQKEQMQGNMHLIVELFKNNLIKSNILINCFDELQQERSNQNVDILTQMMMKLSEFMIAKSKADRQATRAAPTKARPG